MHNNEIAQMIDHAILKPDMTCVEIEGSIKEAVALNVKTVCVNPAYVGLAASHCSGTNTGVCAVVGFPLGQTLTGIKLAEAEACISLGAKEIDMVMNYSWLKSGMTHLVISEISQIKDVCSRYNAILKVIIETDALTETEIVIAVECVCKANADYIKTSTGFYIGQKNDGATEEVIRLISEQSNGRCLIKASGGVRSKDKLLALLRSGASRFGVGYGSTRNILLGTQATQQESY